MVFRDKYELLALRGCDREIALPGREISSARPVQLHLLTGGYVPENQELLRVLESLSADQKCHLLDTGDHDGIPYVVTDTLPGSLSLRSWIASLVIGKAPQPAQPPVRASAPCADPGEFTRLFPATVKSAAQEAPTVTQSTPSLVVRTEPSVRASAPSADPGEFTRLFPATAKPAAPDVPTVTRSTPPPAEPTIGEFTRLMGQPAVVPAKQQVPVTPAPAPQVEPAPEPGAFTAMFQSKPLSASAAAGAAPSIESTGLFQGRVPSPMPQNARPGEFTQAMQTPLAVESLYSKPAPPPQPAAPQGEFTKIMEGIALPKPPVARREPLPETEQRRSPQSEGEFTKIFRADPMPTGNLAAPAASQAPLPHGGLATGAFARQPAFAGSATAPDQSEFTKIIGLPPSPPPATAAPKAPQPPPGRIPPVVKANRSYLPLILILAGLFLLAVIVILVLTLTR